MGRKSNGALGAAGNHSYLAITMRVTLVGIFLKSFLTLHIYIIFEKLFSYKIVYWVPFKLDYVRRAGSVQVECTRLQAHKSLSYSIHDKIWSMISGGRVVNGLG